MSHPSEHRQRRQALGAALGRPALLLGLGGGSTYKPRDFRQDSSFLYYLGYSGPDAAALIEADGHTTLFVVPPAEDDALWHGHVDSLEAQRKALDVDRVLPVSELEAQLAGKDAATFAIADPVQNSLGQALTGIALDQPCQSGDEALLDAVIAQRKLRSEAELEEMRQTAAITVQAHLDAMAATHPGVTEAELRAVFEARLMSQDLRTAYGTILTVHGEVLHNFHYAHTLKDGQLLLLDGGAESKGGYATDVTRTWPVSGRFSPRQAAAYEAVLEAQRVGIAMVRPGVRYRDIHLETCRVLATFMADEGLLRCSADAAVEAGAHAVFFPHGVGHLLGLDVHDLEPFGDRATYDPRYPRSTAFGTAWLRIDLHLQPGMVVTVEPGFYVVPAILNDPALVERFSPQVDFAAAREWVGFGGIRIEDDVAVTGSDPEVLTAALPKEIPELEAIVGSGPRPFGR